jgi:tRNA threonylcarbamoyladenosine biosynthesis protein TsaB
MIKREITLAIETAVAGGSLSLFEGDSIIDKWVGKREVSRSEELIEAISDILKRNRLKSRDLQSLAVSRGPGSYTGARIGLATAIGLKDGLSIKCFGVSILDAFFNRLGNPKLRNITAVSFGKNEICFQSFENYLFYKKGYKKDLPQIISSEKFIQFVNQKMNSIVILNQKLYFNIENHLKIDRSGIVNAGENLSDHIGFLAKKGDGSDNLTPIYPFAL